VNKNKIKISKKKGVQRRKQRGVVSSSGPKPKSKLAKKN
jgi:hypothetical protein